MKRSSDMKSLQITFVLIIGLLFSQSLFAMTISGNISFPNSQSVTNFTRNVLVVAENPLNIFQNQILTVPFNVGQQSRDYSITLPDNGHDWRISYRCTLCNQEELLTTAYVGPEGMVTLAQQARIFPGNQDITNIDIDLITGSTISGTISFPSSQSVTAFTSNVVVVAENPFNVSQFQILTVPFNIGQQSRDYSITLPNNGHDWRISYRCALCNQEGILTDAYVGPLGMVTLAEDARILPGNQSISGINIDLIRSTTLSGTISFPDSESVTNNTRNVLVVAQNPLDASQNQILTVPFNVGQQSRDYSITLPDNGHDWRISYQCTLCNQVGVLTSAYVGAEGMVTVADDARSFSSSQSLSNINIDLISGTTISGTISFPTNESANSFTSEIIVVAQDPLNASTNQILTVPFNIGQQSRDYSITLPNNGNEWIISYQCALCNQQGILTSAYVGPTGMVTLQDQARVLSGEQDNINIELIGGTTFSGTISFPNSESVTNFTRNVLVVAQDPLNASQNQILNVLFNLGQQSREYEITLPDNGNDWIIRYLCALCNQEGILTSAYVGATGMVTLANQARVFAGNQDLSNINISLVDEGTSTIPNPIEGSNIIPTIIFLLLEEELVNNTSQ